MCFSPKTATKVLGLYAKLRELGHPNFLSSSMMTIVRFTLTREEADDTVGCCERTYIYLIFSNKGVKSMHKTCILLGLYFINHSSIHTKLIVSLQVVQCSWQLLCLLGVSNTVNTVQ